MYPHLSCKSLETLAQKGRTSGGQESDSGVGSGCECPSCRHTKDGGGSYCSSFEGKRLTLTLGPNSKVANVLPYPRTSGTEGFCGSFAASHYYCQLSVSQNCPSFFKYLEFVYRNVSPTSTRTNLLLPTGTQASALAPTYPGSSSPTLLLSLPANPGILTTLVSK